MKLVLTCLFLLMAVEVYYAPYTKVEESFNIQAIHDILHHVPHYDHLDFPGVVPRTCLGAVIISVLTWPIIALFPGISLLQQQVVARIMLSATVVMALGDFASGIQSVFGSTTALWTILLTFCQFHLVFWSSRTIPNTMALPWVLMGLSHWLKSTHSHRTSHLKYMIWYLSFTGIVYRFEIGILLIIILAFEFYHQSMQISFAIKHLLIASIPSLLLTIMVDSYFWNQWLWPEGIVFYFNAILNKSAEWGTLPFHAYFCLFLPMILMISYPLSWYGYITDARVRYLMTPMVIYILLFSLMPHKEWRFIMYTIPVFTMGAAVTINRFIIKANRSFLYRFILVAVMGTIAISFAASLLMFRISQLNYPGGEALRRLHDIENGKKNVYVHLDSETAMTGASLFGQSSPYWTYSKNEWHTTQQDFMDAGYTHIITSHPELFDASVYETIDVTNGLSGKRLKTFNEFKESLLSGDMLPIHYEMKPKLYTIRFIDSTRDKVESTLHKHPVVLYSKTYCPYCRRAKKLLSQYCMGDDVYIVEVDLEKDGSGIKRALYDLSGQNTFPNLFVNGQSLGGFDELSKLDRQGKLANVCNRAK
ncbi:Alg9-like mannosyltransferase family-domain-containing protein [Pilobolus umbonatus]|nr:Alg9-like mannosyltransferase family-domain-containing protein [Pilobolus umbonatus]